MKIIPNNLEEYIFILDLLEANGITSEDYDNFYREGCWIRVDRGDYSTQNKETLLL